MKKEITEWEMKVCQVEAYLRLYGDTQEARSVAARNSELLDSAHWVEAVRRRQNSLTSPYGCQPTDHAHDD
jgi:hypothetical protein